MALAFLSAPLVYAAFPAAPSPADPAPPPAAPTAVWEVIEESSTALRIRVDVPELQWIEGPAGAIMIAPGFPGEGVAAGALGWIPVLPLPVALPPQGEFRIRVANASSMPLEKRASDLRPIWAYEDARDGGEREGDPSSPPWPPAEAELFSGRDPSSDFGWVAADAEGFVEWAPAQWAAGTRVLPVRVLAARPDGNGGLRTARSLEIVVSFLPASDGKGPISNPENRPASIGARRSASLAEASVVNPRQARSWGTRPAFAPAPAPVLRAPGGRGDGFSTATSPWLRIGVRERGVYAITAADLEAAGVDPADVDLAQARLFCGRAGALPDTADYRNLPSWMEPCAILVEDDGNGRWDAATRVYFVGNGPDGWYDDLDRNAPGPNDRYYSHPYAQEFHYWLCWGGDFSTPPLRMEEVDAAPQGRPVVQRAVTRAHCEQNLFQDLRPRERDLEWPRFFDLSVRASATNLGASLRVPLPEDPLESLPLSVRVALWGKSWDNPQGPDHYAVIKVNGDTLGSAQWESAGRAVIRSSDARLTRDNLVALYVPQRYLSVGDSLSTIADLVFLDWVEFEYARFLDASSDSLDFFLDPGDQGVTASVSGLDSAAGWLLLDAGSFRAPRVLLPSIESEGSGYAAKFHLGRPADGNEAHLTLLKRTQAARPASIALVGGGVHAWLRSQTGPVEYLIVTAPELLGPATALADHRATHFHGPAGDTLRSASVAVVTTQSIYDEFSYGQHDPAAVRNFLEFARDEWRDGETGLAHVLLLGDPSQDPRHYLAASATDLVPAYLMYTWSYQTLSNWEVAFLGDDWFALLDGPQDKFIDFSVGRLPVGSAPQAWAVVGKIIANETSAPIGSWRSRLIFAADDICQGNKPDDLGYRHIIQTEALCLEVPEEARLGKIFLYEYGSECRYERKPQAAADFLAAIEEGALLVNYVGHGSDVQLADERLLDLSSIASMANEDKPFLFVTASCAVGRFSGDETGLAVEALRLPERGALAAVSATATAASQVNFKLNQYLLRNLFPRGTLTDPRAIGPALTASKWSSLSDNDFRYSLLGDPDSRFTAPARPVRLWIEGVPGVEAGSDTLLRGGPAILAGEVFDEDSSLAAAFDGTADVLVLDSDFFRDTPYTGLETADYLLPGARIFSGRVPVASGRFSCPFFVPTALRVGERGPARAFAYVRTEDEGSEAGATSEDGAGGRGDLIIPEIRLNSADTLGPVIHLTWQNPDEIVPGTALWATLQDSSGIYVAGLSPSRSVVLTIIDPEERVLVAEDLASAVSFTGDYRSAWLRYSLPSGLPVGEMLTLALEASDNLGKRTREALEFRMKGGAGASEALLGMVYNLPNPMETETRFLCELSRPAELEVTLYTISGRKILSLAGGLFTPARAREAGILWDGRDQDGDRLANGLYFFRLSARESDGSSEERIERLVVMR